MHAAVTIQCNASEKGLGAILLQNGQPVAFASRTLSQVEQQYAQIEECLAIILACSKFSQCITRRQNITVETDHKPLPVYLQEVSPNCSKPTAEDAAMTPKVSSNSEIQAWIIADHLSRPYLSQAGDQPKD